MELDFFTGIVNLVTALLTLGVAAVGLLKKF
jgi:hypothetical protein